jgi:hypothetical protein
MGARSETGFIVRGFGAYEHVSRFLAQDAHGCMRSHFNFLAKHYEICESMLPVLLTA